jgi:transcriptional/translational regulatory protein YebC/TACO1
MINQEELTNKKINFEDLELELIDVGASDIKQEAEGLTIYTNLVDFQKMTDYLNNKALKTESGEIEYVAKEKITLNAEDAEKVDKFLEEFDGNEDVSDYYTNIDL